MEPFIGNIETLTLENENFRKVVFTGPKSQLVLMSLLPGEEIGLETHPHVDQFFRIEKGSGVVIVGEKEYPVWGEFGIVIPAGTTHNVKNTGAEAMKLYTIYSPANHIDGRIHKTKEEASLDVEDEDFGHKNI